MWSEMNRLRNELDRLFTGNGMRRFAASVYPPVNLWEDDDNLYLEAELPGLDLDGLEILVTGDVQLSLKGERNQPEVQQGTWHRQERGYGSFSRVIELPQYVDADKVSAQFKLGVLTLTMPKKEEAKARRIEVKSD
jgi:HSP20 family protein